MKLKKKNQTNCSISLNKQILLLWALRQEKASEPLRENLGNNIDEGLGSLQGYS